MENQICEFGLIKYKAAFVLYLQMYLYISSRALLKLAMGKLKCVSLFASYRDPPIFASQLCFQGCPDAGQLRWMFIP